ncbi:bromodomain-containing protein DDB_G0270170-like isoform X2 [Plodia interpunctella]|nr:bromodomain-containing protein DDB_G0270170-like isoform X2 [Plodia interpunctella]
MREDDGSRLEKQDAIYAEEEEEAEAVEKPVNTEEKRNAPAPSDSSSVKEKCNSDSPDYKMHNDRESEEMKSNDYQPQPLQQRPSRYVEAKDPNEHAEMTQRLGNTDKREKFARRAVYKWRSAKTTTDYDKGDELVDNAIAKERTNKLKNHQSNNDAPVEQNHEEFFKNYYKTLHATNEKEKLEDKNYESYPSNAYRNRRQANDAEVSANSKVNDQSSVNENEETAIKRHIKKLTDEELESLLNSLPTEKRALLNKIIESEKGHFDAVSKRDITKKAGAVEENNDIDNGVFDSNKVHGSSVEIKNDVGSAIDTTDIPKPSEYQTEISGVSGSKKTSSQEISPDKDNSGNVEDKSSVSLNEVSNNGESKAQVESDIQVTKLNTKRETNVNDLENQCSSLGDTKLVNKDLNTGDINENGNYDTGYNNYQNEDLSQLAGNEALLENNVLDHVNKREALIENTDSFKSLEESFPNSNSYKESGEYSEIDMVPLVRVKRRNEDALLKKRNALLVPDAKTAHIPYRAENDDDDSEEGNEFEDDGFYDRTSNYGNGNVRLSGNVMSSKDIQTKRQNMGQADISPDANIESDTMNIGSDSDSVLSGVEGVDDNLMYNSGARNKRTVENKPTDLVSKDSGLSSLIELESKAQSDNLNAVNYRENDAFGPLPQNYEGGLSRMKRIRRVKSPCNSDSSPDAQG